MKKIVCPRCGVVNLEKFVTFPHCAGCSALLPGAREPMRGSVWRRPLRVGFWASLVGLALAGAVALSFSAREAEQPQQLVLYAQLPRQARLGQVLVCRLGVDSRGSDEGEGAILREVSWRLARSSERDWNVLGVSPEPDAQDHSLSRAAWVYSRWPVGERCILRLQPRTRGARALAIIASAREHFPVQWRTTVTVR